MWLFCDTSNINVTVIQVKCLRNDPTVSGMRVKLSLLLFFCVLLLSVKSHPVCKNYQNFFFGNLWEIRPNLNNLVIK